MKRRLGALAAAAIAAVAGHAYADPTGVVVLKDGTIVHGSIVELVNGDHVVVQVDGQPKMFPWAAVASVLENTAPSPAPPTGMFDLHPDQDGPLVDWPEPDRTPPRVMPSRLSLGLEAGVGGIPVGTYAFAAELYPWTWSIFQVGFHAAYGPAGFVGPTLAEMMTFDISYGPVQQGFGIGLAHSFRANAPAMPGEPGRVDVLDTDLSHISVFITRRVMLRAMLGLAFPLTSGCDNAGKICGNTSAVYGLASLMWNFDMSGGDQ